MEVIDQENITLTIRIVTTYSCSTDRQRRRLEVHSSKLLSITIYQLVGTQVGGRVYWHLLCQGCDHRQSPRSGLSTLLSFLQLLMHLQQDLVHNLCSWMAPLLMLQLEKDVLLEIGSVHHLVASLASTQ